MAQWLSKVKATETPHKLDDDVIIIGLLLVIGYYSQLL